MQKISNVLNLLLFIIKTILFETLFCNNNKIKSQFNHIKAFSVFDKQYTICISQLMFKVSYQEIARKIKVQ